MTTASIEGVARRAPWWVWWLVFAGGLTLAHDSGHLSLEAALWFGALLPAAILHEVSHGLAALACGDRTALDAGRLTANPLAHISPFTTIILPILTFLAVGWPFGAAKPVPVRLDRLRRPRNQSVLVALAGPGSNLVLAGVLYGVSLLAGVHGLVPEIPSFGAQPTWMLALYEASFLNLMLAAFNLLPIPPLDGSAVIERVLPDRFLPGYFGLRRLMFPVAMVILLLGHNVLSGPAMALERWWFHIYYGV